MPSALSGLVRRVRESRLGRLSFRTKLVVAFAGLACVTAAVVLHQAWRTGRRAQIEGLRRLLEAVASSVAPGVDGDEHVRLAALAREAETDADAKRRLLHDPAYRSLRALAER